MVWCVEGLYVEGLLSGGLLCDDYGIYRASVWRAPYGAGLCIENPVSNEVVCNV